MAVTIAMHLGHSPWQTRGVARLFRARAPRSPGLAAGVHERERGQKRPRLATADGL